MRAMTGTLLAAALLLPASVWAAAGEVSFLEGTATRTPAKGQPIALLAKGTVEQGDLLETGKAGKLEITLSDKSVVRLGPSSKLKLDQAAFTDTSRSFKATLLLGKVWSKVTSVFGEERNFEVRTERAVAGVRGTVFRIDAESTKAVLVKVYDGSVAVAGSTAAAAAPAPKKGERVEVPGPSAVDKKQWEKIVGAMMQVKVSAKGEVAEPTKFSEEDEARDAFAAWNRKRDLASAQ
ncbi:MAG: FecR domain-containing protein [Deltaproteobacteria bacterium]|nr:FecR domain-containing protein [Deltaproteobacteria bacterium]